MRKNLNKLAPHQIRRGVFVLLTIFWLSVAYWILS